MKKMFLVLALQCIICLSVFSQGGGGVKNGLVAGQVAPVFTGKDQNGNSVSLSQFQGKKVILYFYPKDDTPGCTAEACNLRDNYEALIKQGYVVIGVSTDGQSSHQEFKSKYNLPFTLIADVDTTINKLYDVWVEKERDGKKFWGTQRRTFIIDENGVISDRIDTVDTKQHAQQILSPKPVQKKS